MVAAWAATATSGWLAWLSCGFGWMLRDTSQTVREIARDMDKIERSQAVVLYHLKLKTE